MKKEQQLNHHQTNWKNRVFPLVLACDNWYDPLNVGMAFRLADAFGVEEVWLGGSTPVPPSRKIKKTARSTDQWVPFKHKEDLAASLASARTAGHQLIGVEITTGSIALDTFVKTNKLGPTVLVMGAENAGIQAAVLNILDACVHIPMYGRGSSLNVATALAIALYGWTGGYE